MKLNMGLFAKVNLGISIGAKPLFSAFGFSFSNSMVASIISFLIIR